MKESCLLLKSGITSTLNAVIIHEMRLLNERRKLQVPKLLEKEFNDSLRIKRENIDVDLVLLRELKEELIRCERNLEKSPLYGND